jgi:Uma2 family endonuclease
MPAVENKLMTVEEFRQLPEPVGPYDYELRDGVVTPVTRPRFKHARLQKRLCFLLEAVAPAGSYVDREVAFRSSPELNLRVAGVAYLGAERHAAVDPDDYISGSPDLVVEVLSPSNTAAELLEKEQICLENGASEFWVIDDRRRQVRVTSVTGQVHVYKSGQSIPLTVLGVGELAVDAIFA